MSSRIRSTAMIVVVAASIVVTAVAAASPAGAQQPIDPCVELSVQAVAQQALCEVTVTKDLVSKNPAQVGDTVTFDIVVTNTGAFPLTNVTVSDIYDATLDFTGANPVPTDTDESLGIIVWEDLLPSPDGGLAGVWDSGEERTLTVSFKAAQKPSAENCAIALADVYSDFQGDEVVLYQQQEPLGVESDLVCDDVRITSEAKKTRTPRTSATQPPANTPVPVITVAGVTVVPPTRPAGVIVAPDTGTGDGTGPGGLGAAVVLTSVAVALAIAGAAVTRRGMR